MTPFNGGLKLIPHDTNGISGRISGRIVLGWAEIWVLVGLGLGTGSNKDNLMTLVGREFGAGWNLGIGWVGFGCRQQQKQPNDACWRRI